MIDGKFTMNDIAKSLDVSVQTIKRWVWWFEWEGHEGTVFEEPVPLYKTIKGVRLWDPTPETIEQFRRFRKSLGDKPFAEYNALHSWGRRGKEIAGRKSLGDK